MLIPAPPRPPRREMVLPMINVVFLLLVFFMLAARVAPPDPLPVTLPEAAAGDPADGPLVLHLGANGQLAFRDAMGEDAALTALRVALGDAERDGPMPKVLLRADRAVPGARVAALLPQLAALGLRDVSLVTSRP
ncbi:Biopolymer transport protein ExbD/TolR [Rhodovulum sp. P5]|uniref:ExbD/TolR family protein n=1 Tax=Rhodovulum sp. P5 TaxID=1564506 RepID=UPI0009C33A5F|nr:biopolymer transporter ExbD [Rhodovulum sp. P5]ARE39822.1 Biopolymer transport protein ExbD/TolR [Rhodovulum sp. P5]